MKEKELDTYINKISALFNSNLLYENEMARKMFIRYVDELEEKWINTPPRIY
jgi:hypothetical protein